MQHHRTHDLLLIKKLLDFRDNASPCTIVLDSLEQGGKHLLREVIAGAQRSKARVILVSSETLQAPKNVSIFVDAIGLDFKSLARDLGKQIVGSSQRTLLIYDCLNILLHRPNASSELPTFLSSLISPTTSVVAVYHLDVPVPHDVSTCNPPPLVLLKYLATTLLTTHSLSQVIAAKEARQRSVAQPVFGLSEEREGVIVGLDSNDPKGTVVEMEYRRKSGRAVHQTFFVSRRQCSVEGPATITLLDDQPDYRAVGRQDTVATAHGVGSNAAEGTFDLSLTDKQRRDRDGVVLPYFDAQKAGGVGDGGRILYDMGEEDDFDEEEDEI